jgi:MinD superfamily P-loop ATPase
MRQLVILSGKGGTGKTSVAAAFAHLASSGDPPVRVVLADADVDAANLELVLDPQPLETHEFVGGAVAVIDQEMCQACGTCYDVCRFDAVLSPSADGRTSGQGVQGEVYLVDPIACEGCAACVYQCPEQAIRMEPQLAGHWFRSYGRYGPLFHAALLPAQENSGKLVTLVKQQARLLALDEEYAVVLVDGPPGIGCPVISAASGADLALVVVEPTAAGVHDMQRVLATAAHFRVPAMVCINKADVYPAGVDRIESYCQERGIEIIGRIPFDATVTEAMVQGQPVTAITPEAPASQALVAMWQRIAGRVSELSA